MPRQLLDPSPSFIQRRQTSTCSQALKDSPRRCLACVLRVRDRCVGGLHMHIGIDGSRYAQKSVEVANVCVGVHSARVHAET